MLTVTGDTCHVCNLQTWHPNLRCLCGEAAKLVMAWSCQIDRPSPTGHGKQYRTRHLLIGSAGRPQKTDTFAQVALILGICLQFGPGCAD